MYTKFDITIELWLSLQPINHLLCDIESKMTEAEPKTVDKKDFSGKSSKIIPGGFAGTGPNGSFFETPEWVDKNKPPGLTSQEKMYAPPGMYILKKPFLIFLLI